MSNQTNSTNQNNANQEKPTPAGARRTHGPHGLGTPIPAPVVKPSDNKKKGKGK